MSWIENRLENGLLVTSLDWAINCARASSIWPLSFGVACCAFEMMATAASRWDLDRFGAGLFRAAARQSDLMIFAGTVTYKLADRLRRLYNQMPEPKWVMAMGACTIGGGPYFKHGYHVAKGVDLIVPVDVYVPGCPARGVAGRFDANTRHYPEFDDRQGTPAARESSSWLEACSTCSREAR